jgi:hypothetical protein
MSPETIVQGRAVDPSVFVGVLQIVYQPPDVITDEQVSFSLKDPPPFDEAVLVWSGDDKEEIVVTAAKVEIVS